MRKHICDYIKDKSGTVLAMAAVMTPLILSMTGVGIDISTWMMSKRNLQTAADSAAVAAAWEIANGFTEATAEQVATQEALRNGYDPVNSNGKLVLTTSLDIDGNTRVDVSITHDAPTYFSKVFTGDVTITTSSSALMREGITSEYCYLSLAETGSATIGMEGTVNLDAADCGLAINSNNVTALDLTGTSVANVGDINIVGTHSSGSRVTFNYNSITENSEAVLDPYADLEIDPYGNCDYNDYVDTNGGTLNPGVYCGGIRLGGSNRNYTMNPGTYILVDGHFTVDGGNGQVVGEGVTIILTSSDGDFYGNMNVGGSKDIFFSAPAAGEPYEGVAIYQDRDAFDGSGPEYDNSLLGTASVIIQGAAYFPSRDVDIGGDHDNLAVGADQDVCTRVIAQRITFHGTPTVGNNCDNVAVEDIYGPGGESQVRLIL
jgi:Flp pilus assembly protein TadG